MLLAWGCSDPVHSFVKAVKLSSHALVCAEVSRIDGVYSWRRAEFRVCCILSGRVNKAAVILLLGSRRVKMHKYKTASAASSFAF